MANGCSSCADLRVRAQAPMSTTTDMSVAVAYSRPHAGGTSLLFKLRTNNFMDRGGSIAFLSAFPFEAEFLVRALALIE